jgi:ketosteroid isomerase-like protein
VTAPGPHHFAEEWLAILSRPTLEEFAEAFGAKPTLETSVLASPIGGVQGIRDFFDATRAMYDRIEFTAEHRLELWTCLEWMGVYRGRPIAGATILMTDANGAIERIRLFHAPLDQLVEFAADLHRRLDLVDLHRRSVSASSGTDITVKRPIMRAPTEHARSLVKSFYDGGARGEIASFRDSLAESFELFVPAYLPWGGSFGKQAYVDLLPRVASVLDFTRLRYLSLTAEGHHVVALIEIGVQGSDKSIIISEHWDVEGDKATRLLVAYFDPKALLDQVNRHAVI